MCVFISPCWTWPSLALGLFFALVVLLEVSGQSLLFDVKRLRGRSTHTHSGKTCVLALITSRHQRTA